MNLSRNIIAFALSITLLSISFLNLTVQNVSAQDTTIAVQRGYRTGYSDGYMSGYRDSIENGTKSYEKHDEYSRASRAFNKDYGTIEDYQDGYRQGFESGYDTGFEKRSFDANVPANLNRRSVTVSKTTIKTPVPKTTVEEKAPEKLLVETTAAIAPVEPPVSQNPTPAPTLVSEQISVSADNAPATASAKPEAAADKPQYVNSALIGADTIVIPVDTELIVELLDDVNTERNREGDKFQARIVSPNEIGGAIIEGRISKIQRPGRIKRRAEVLLSFDRIVLTGNRWSNFNAILTEVLPVKGDNVKRVDTEGTVEGRSSVKDDSIKVGATTGTGLVVGAIAGGPVGAAVGAGVGAAFGVGGVVIERGKDIRLGKNQQLRIKTGYETQIR